MEDYRLIVGWLLSSSSGDKDLIQMVMMAVVIISQQQDVFRHPHQVGRPTGKILMKQYEVFDKLDICGIVFLLTFIFQMKYLISSVLCFLSWSLGCCSMSRMTGAICSSRISRLVHLRQHHHHF